MSCRPTNGAWSDTWRLFALESEGVHGTSDAAAAGTVQDVSVDHRGVDVLVAEKLLDRPDVVAVLDQVGREGMAERVAVDGPLDADFVDGLLHGALEDSFVDVVAPDGVRARIGRAFPGREEPLPGPLLRGSGVLPFEGVGQVNTASPVPTIFLVQLLDAREPGDELRAHRGGKRDESVLLAFRVTDEDAAHAELDVLDSKAQAFEQSHSRAVEEHSHDPVHAVKPLEDPLDLGAGHHGRQADGALGADEVVESGEGFFEDVASCRSVNVTLRTLERLSRAFGVDVTQLFTT
jgi:hypothetical protein